MTGNDLVEEEISMEMLLKFQCLECGKTFIVEDLEVDGSELSCPHCQEEVPVPECDDDEEE